MLARSSPLVPPQVSVDQTPKPLRGVIVLMSDPDDTFWLARAKPPTCTNFPAVQSVGLIREIAPKSLQGMWFISNVHKTRTHRWTVVLRSQNPLSEQNHWISVNLWHIYISLLGYSSNGEGGGMGQWAERTTSQSPNLLWMGLILRAQGSSLRTSREHWLSSVHAGPMIGLILLTLRRKYRMKVNQMLDEAWNLRGTDSGSSEEKIGMLCLKF